ncbi:hypothetical protein P3W45_000938 [Vairimorpha bombi]|jgi:hypothetical protein
MEEGELLIKELRIDNETLLTEEYNPLIQVFKNKKSNTSFRNTYHRVEKVMENIINVSYKGFSDSVLSYMEVYNLNTKNIFLLNETCSLLKMISTMKFDVKDVREVYGTTKHLSIKNEMVDLLNEVNKSMGEYSESTDLQAKCNILIRIREMIRYNKLFLVDGINILRNDLLLEIDRFMICVYEKILEYIKDDKIENKEYLRIIRVMDKFKELDEFLFTNMRSQDYSNTDHEDNNIIDNLRSINQYFSCDLKIYKKLLKIKSAEHHHSDDSNINMLLLFDDRKYKQVDYTDDTLYFYKHINCINSTNIKLLYKKIKEVFADKDVNYYLINTLMKINKKVNYRLLDDLIKKYTRILEKEIIEEVLYLFDIFCREGNYKSEYYINKILGVIDKNIKVIELNKNIVPGIVKRINEYLSNQNEKNEEFSKRINLLDEVLGEYTDECIGYSR